MAALLLAAGISPFCVRVALGRLAWADGRPRNDHAWVLYRDERGVWRLLDPSLTTSSWDFPDAASLSVPGAAFHYQAEFVLNSQHLWIVDPPVLAQRRRRGKKSFDAYVEGRKRFARLQTRFWYRVHEDILGTALDGMASAKEIDLFVRVNRHLDFPSWLGGDEYHPREHFDNALIQQSFDLARKNLSSGKLEKIGKALHALGDFYAHSSFLDVGVAAYGAPEKVPPYYRARIDPTFASTLARFTYTWDRTGIYRGKLVSGAYDEGDDGKDAPPDDLSLRHDDYAADGKPWLVWLLSGKRKNNTLYLDVRKRLASDHIRFAYRHGKPY
jgi:hypothetical protein